MSGRLGCNLPPVRRLLTPLLSSTGVSVMLMSLKCGVGLNLTEASTVVLCEPWWNPAVEEQAIDRIHRIGQQREVDVVRLALPGTVEDRIMQLQEKKRAMSRDVLGDCSSSTAAPGSAGARLSDRDLMNILGF